MAYPFILMIVCTLNVVVGLVSSPYSTANERGKWTFIVMFQAALIWLIVEAALWLTR